MTIHQLLHGYERGHRLLASSVAVPQSVERTIAVQSDLSGPSPVSGFDSYLSGYPLPDLKCFAFARTWYASEQSRPGCVWTHTLLLEHNFLDHAPSLFSLVNLFRRPPGPLPGYPDYQTPLISPEVTAEQGPSALSPTTTALAGRVLLSLYDDADVSVVIPAFSATEYQDLVIAIWSQQWPALRRAFTFSTGSLAPRNLGKIPFDLQIVPIASARQITRSIKKVAVLDTDKMTAVSESPSWVQQALVGIVSPSGPVRTPIAASLVEKAPADRSYFPLLVALSDNSLALSRESSTTAMVDTIAQLYPAPDDGLTFKSRFLRAAFDADSNHRFGIPRNDLLASLSSARITSTFDAHLALIAECTRSLAQTEPQAAKELLKAVLQTERNSIGESVARNLLTSLEHEPAIELIAELPGALPLMVELDPKICVLPEAWRGSRRQHYEILDALTRHSDLAESTRNDIVRTVLAVGISGVASPLVRHFGAGILRELLDWYDSSQTSGIPTVAQDWIEQLAANTREVTAWLRDRTDSPAFPTIALVTSCLDPTADYIATVPERAWSSASDKQHLTTTQKGNSRVGTFLLTVAFRGLEGYRERLAVQNFEPVHNAILERDLGYEEWQWISTYLSDLGWYRNWDRAEKLRRGLIERFVRLEWPISEFIHCVSSNYNWELLVRTCRETDSGRSLLAMLRTELDANTVALPDKWRSTLLRIGGLGD